MLLTLLSFTFDLFDNWQYYAIVEVILEVGAIALYILMEVTK